jgi:hypothetical protein
VRPRVSQALGILTAAAAAYLAFLLSSYFFPPHLPRHRLESVFFFLIAFGVLSIVTRPAAGTARSSRTRPLSPVTALLVFAAVALLAWLTYRPALAIGLLSDDFIVAEFARRHQWIYGSDLAFARPAVPMLWAALEYPPVSFDRAIHATNVALHAANGLLVTMIAARTGMPRLQSIAAGFFFVVSPGLTEAVAWATGIHDVLMTTFVLTAVVSATIADRGLRWSVLAVAASVLAIAAKETGVVAPLLAGVVLWASGSRVVRGRTGWTLGLMLGVNMIYVAWRVARGVPAGYGEDIFRLYFVKQLVVGPFAALGAPWTIGWAADHPVRAFIRCAALVVLVTIALLTWRRRDVSLRHALAFAAWVLIGILPVFSLFYVGPSLEGSRYLYLSAAGFALLISVLAGTGAARFPWLLRVPAFIAAMLVIALPIVPAFRHEISRWQEAARARDEILSRAAANQWLGRCESFVTSGAADSVDGAFVFHNGLPQALARQSGVKSEDSRGGRCRMAWNGSDLLVVPE